MRSHLFQILTEVPLWIAANVLCSAAPTALVHRFGPSLFGWSMNETAFFTTATLLVTMTWGSWAALIWSRSRAVRVGLRASTILPGLITAGLGVVGLYTGFGSIFHWGLIVTSGVGTAAAAVTLSKTLGVRPTEWSSVNLMAGLVLFPVATMAASAVIGGLWANMISNPLDGSWRSLISLSTIMFTIMANALTSTIIPAITSTLVQRGTLR